MLNELYVVNENGQMEMNFEALELITSTEFVDTVKRKLALKDMKLISVNMDVYITVTVASAYTLCEISYFERTGDVEVKSVSYYDAKKYIAIMDGVEK